MTDVKGRSVKTLPSELGRPYRGNTPGFPASSSGRDHRRHRSGKLTPAIYSTSTMRDRSGEAFGIVAVFSDLTRLRELETEKRRTERLASIGAFAANMAHEIKNPLVAIKTFAELLPERFTEEEFESVLQGRNKRNREDRRTGGTPSWASHASTKAGCSRKYRGTRQRSPFSPQRTVRASANQCHYALDEDLPTVAGDQAQLRQLLLNVLMNAVEAMPTGDLTVRLSRRGSSEPHIVSIEVRDTGQGIPNDLLEKIFDPFVTTKSQGSGLGLAICQGIIEAHRGTILAANNTPGPGATITVGLPITRDSRPPLNAR